MKLKQWLQGSTYGDSEHTGLFFHMAAYSMPHIHEVPKSAKGSKKHALRRHSGNNQTL